MKNQQSLPEKKIKKQVKSGTKKKHQVTTAVINIFASFNNTIITISETNGNVVCWSSAGGQGFKGSKKATPYAAQVAMQKALSTAKERGLESVYVKVSGPGVGRESSLRAIQASGVVVHSIKDTTYFPHNGCRPPKKRRV